MAQVIKLNGTAIKQPLEFGMESYNLTKSDRVQSGKMQMDLVAKKRKFTFKYEVLSGTDLKTILDVIDGNDMFFTLTYTDDNTGTEKTATVYVGAITRDKFRTDGPWYWKNVTFNLIEQ